MNRISSLMKICLIAGTAIGWTLGAVSMASAVDGPHLQLDIDATNVFYNTTTSSVATTDSTFTLYAYLNPTGQFDIDALLADTYYVSIALSPQTGPTHGSYGSFDVDGTTVQVTQDMTYGTPPLEGSSVSDPGDLPTHSIFPTFFTEVAIQFNALDQTTPYNTQDTRFADGFDDTGSGMYFVAIEIDKTNLNPDLQLHFDLYNTAVVECGRNPNCVPGDIDLDDQPYAFAPFSHDAETVIPEPTGLLLFSAGLMVVGYSLRQRR